MPDWLQVYYVAHEELEHLAVLNSLSEFWNYGHEPPCLVYA